MLSTVQQRKVQVLQCHAIQHVLQCSLQFCATVRCRVENGFYKQRAWSSGSSSYLVAAEPSKEAYSAFKQPARPCKVDILSSMCLLWNPVRKLAYTRLSTSWYIVHYRPSAEPNPERKLTRLSSSQVARLLIHIVQYITIVELSTRQLGNKAQPGCKAADTLSNICLRLLWNLLEASSEEA